MSADHSKVRFRNFGELSLYAKEHNLGATHTGGMETIDGVTRLILVEKPKPVDNSWLDIGANDQRFQFIPAAQYVNRPYQRWLIKGVVPQAQLGFTYADYGVGKSPFLLSMACAMELGIDWFGYKVAPFLKTALLIAEGAPEYKNRLEAYAIENKVDIAKLPRINADVPDLRSESDARLIAKQLGEIDFLVIDTFAASFIGDENSGEDAGAALRNAKLVSTLTHAMIMFAGHPGKNIAKGIRGWSGIPQALDTIIFIDRNGNDIRSANVEKQKGGSEGSLFSFSIKVHEVGRDVDDEVQSGVVIRKCETPTRESAPKQFIKANQIAIRDALLKLAPMARTAHEDDVIEEALVFTKIDLSDSAKVVQKRKNLNRALEDVIEKGLVFRHEGGHVSLSSVLAAEPDEAHLFDPEPLVADPLASAAIDSATTKLHKGAPPNERNQ